MTLSFSTAGPGFASCTFTLLMRQCKKCGEDKPLERFVRNARSRVGYSRECRECCTARNRANYHARRATGYRAPGWEERRQIVEDARQQPCADCGNAYLPPVMQFDHVRGTKVANVSALVVSGPTSRLLDEMAKCELVCANCHCLRTFNRRSP